MINAVEIGKRLARNRGDMTQAEVAKAVGVSVSSVAMYESGSRVPRDEIKVALARLYETSVEALFFAP